MSDYGILGDLDNGPLETVVNDQDLMPEKQAARFSKTKEYKALKAHLESRIDFYRQNLPGGTNFGELLATNNYAEIGEKAAVSATIINEFQAVIDSYEQAADAVKNKKNG